MLSAGGQRVPEAVLKVLGTWCLLRLEAAPDWAGLWALGSAQRFTILQAPSPAFQAITWCSRGSDWTLLKR